MPEETFLGPATPVWVYIVNVGQVLLVVWFGFILLLGSWKLFRFLIKWKP